MVFFCRRIRCQMVDLTWFCENSSIFKALPSNQRKENTSLAEVNVCFNRLNISQAKMIFISSWFFVYTATFIHLASSVQVSANSKLSQTTCFCQLCVCLFLGRIVAAAYFFLYRQHVRLLWLVSHFWPKHLCVDWWGLASFFPTRDLVPKNSALRITQLWRFSQKTFWFYFAFAHFCFNKINTK